jgi:hypothetical protein
MTEDKPITATPRKRQRSRKPPEQPIPAGPPTYQISSEPATTPKRTGRRFAVANTAFSTWLEGSGKSAGQVAKEAGISLSSVYGIRKGNQQVSLETARALIRVSDGALTYESFLHDEPVSDCDAPASVASPATTPDRSR